MSVPLAKRRIPEFKEGASRGKKPHGTGFGGGVGEHRLPDAISPRKVRRHSSRRSIDQLRVPEPGAASRPHSAALHTSPGGLRRLVMPDASPAAPFFVRRLKGNKTLARDRSGRAPFSCTRPGPARSGKGGAGH